MCLWVVCIAGDDIDANRNMDMKKLQSEKNKTKQSKALIRLSKIQSMNLASFADLIILANDKMVI